MLIRRLHHIQLHPFTFALGIPFSFPFTFGSTWLRGCCVCFYWLGLCRCTRRGRFSFSPFGRASARVFFDWSLRTSGCRGATLTWTRIRALQKDNVMLVLWTRQFVPCTLTPSDGSVDAAESSSTFPLAFCASGKNEYVILAS